MYVLKNYLYLKQSQVIKHAYIKKIHKHMFHSKSLFKSAQLHKAL